MARKKYKIGDKVNFTFLGENLEGVIEKIEEKEIYHTQDKVRYTIFDGEYKYPMPVENIKGVLK
jgi:hypothetical protein